MCKQMKPICKDAKKRAIYTKQNVWSNHTIGSRAGKLNKWILLGQSVVLVDIPVVGVFVSDRENEEGDFSPVRTWLPRDSRSTHLQL